MERIRGLSQHQYERAFVDALEASRAYEANIGVMEVTKSLKRTDAQHFGLMNGLMKTILPDKGVSKSNCTP